jgi:hypothetical protein
MIWVKKLAYPELSKQQAKCDRVSTVPRAFVGAAPAAPIRSLAASVSGLGDSTNFPQQP